MLVARTITIPVALAVLVCGLLMPGLAEAKPAPTIAVSYFENNTGDEQYSPLSRGLADMLITDLSSVTGAQIVERNRLNLLLQELELSKSPFIDPTTAVKMGRGLGANYIVTGAFASVDPLMRIDARIVDVATGKVIHSSEVHGPIADFFLLEKELALTLTEGIGIKLTAKENAKLGRVATDSFEAFRAWSASLEAIDRGEIEVARRALDEALEKDSGFGPAAKLLSNLKTTTSDLSSRRHAMLVSDAASIIKALKKLKRTKGSKKEVLNIIDFGAVESSLPTAAREAREIARMVMDLKIPDTVQFGVPGYRRSVNNWAMSTYVMASYHLHSHADVVSYGQAFMKRYPRGRYFRAIESIVNQTVSDLSRAREGRQKVPAIKEAANVRRQELLCRHRRDLEQKIRDCATFVTRIAASKTAEKRDKRLNDGIEDLIDAVETSPTSAALVLAQKTIQSASKDRDILKSLENLKTFAEKRQAAADRAPADIQDITCRWHPQRSVRLKACRNRARLSRTLGEKRLLSSVARVLSEAGKKGHEPTTMLSTADFVTPLAASLPPSTRITERINQLRQSAAARQRSGDEAAKVKPKNLQAALRASEALWAAGRARQAKRLISSALLTYPDDGGLQDILVRMALDEGDIRSAQSIANTYARSRANAGLSKDDRLARKIDSHQSKLQRHARSEAKEHADAARALFEAGRRSEAKKLLSAALRRFPSNKSLNRAALDFAENEGNRAAAMKAVEHWKRAAGPDAVSSRLQKSAARIPTYLETRHVESQVQDELAHNLAKAGQWQVAADLFLRIAREFPKGHSPEEDSLNEAAKYYRLCGKIKKSRALYEEIAKRFNGSRKAEVAATMLGILPK